MEMGNSRALVVAVALAAAACAGGRSASTPAVLLPTRPAEVEGSLGGRPALSPIAPHEVTLDAPVQRVWAALTEVWAELKVPVTAADTGTHTLVSTRQRVRRIGGVGVDQYFDCAGAYENLASRGDLFLELRSQAQPAGEGRTVVQTVAAALVRPADNSALISCPSNGRLQRLIRTRLQAKLSLGSGS